METEQSTTAPSRRKRRAYYIGIPAGALLLWGAVWLGSDHVRRDIQAVIILELPGGRMMVPLGGPQVGRQPSPILANQMEALLERAARQERTEEATLATVTAGLCPVEVRRGNWTRVKYQLGRLTGNPDPGNAVAIVSPPLQWSRRLYLRRTPAGAFYLSLTEDRKGILQSALIAPDVLAGEQLARILTDHWVGWPQKAETAPAAKDANG